MPDSHSTDRRRIILGALASTLLSRGKATAQVPSPALAADSRASESVTTLIDARPALATLKPQIQTEVWSIGGQIPGPIIRARRGEEFRARLQNNLDRPLTLHWQGVRLANAMDGVAPLTQSPVMPGGSFDIRFVPPDSGSFLYRPMVIGQTGELTDRGLSGLFVVEEDAQPAHDGEIDLLVDDWRLNDDGQPERFGLVQEAASLGRLGNILTVSGASAPRREAAAPGARLRLRLASACNARLMRVRFDGLKAWTIAINGQPTDSFEPLKAMLPLLPGTRYDMIVEVPDQEGAQGTVTGLLGTGTAPLLVLTAQGAPASASRGALPPVTPLKENTLLPSAIPLQRAVRAEMVIAGGAQPVADGFSHDTGDPARIWTVNGIAGNGQGKPLFTVKRGTSVVIALTNRTAFPQVMHLHGHAFRYLHPFDDGWEPYWLDTVLVPEGRTIRIAFVADNPGRWLIGASILERLDTGLNTWFEVK